MSEHNPNTKLYQLTWNDTDAPYVSADHRTQFTLGEAMRIADREEVSVIDPETSRVLWVGSQPTRSVEHDPACTGFFFRERDTGRIICTCGYVQHD